MWGLIAKVTLFPGKRDEMIALLRESAGNMPGCLSYVVAKDAADENTIWVTEVWDGVASHDASLALPAVKNAIPRGKALVSNFERIAVTSPVWAAGLPAVTDMMGRVAPEPPAAPQRPAPSQPVPKAAARVVAPPSPPVAEPEAYEIQAETEELRRTDFRAPSALQKARDKK